MTEIEILDMSVDVISLGDLDSLHLFAEQRIAAIERSMGMPLDKQAEIRRWTEFILKVQMCKGFGAKQRIEEMERRVAEIKRQKRLPSPA